MDYVQMIRNVFILTNNQKKGKIKRKQYAHSFI